jgi:hypothetical protein
MNETRSRRTFLSGKINPEVLLESFNLENLEPIK